MLNFFIGLLFGAMGGFLLAALCYTAKDDPDDEVRRLTDELKEARRPPLSPGG
jgi:hypothetical protein